MVEYCNTPDSGSRIGELERGKGWKKGELVPTPFASRMKGLAQFFWKSQFFQEVWSGKRRNIISWNTRSSTAQIIQSFNLKQQAFRL